MRDTLLTTAPWALALGFALGAHAGWFCPGHQHAPRGDLVSSDVVDIGDVFADADDPCTRARRDRAAKRVRQLAKQAHRVSETHRVPAGLVEALIDDPRVLSKDAKAELVLRDGQPLGFRIARTTRGGPLARLGLRDGDIITHVRGRPLHTANDLVAAVSSLRGATKVGIRIERNDHEIRKHYLIE
jgi:C-terminal processing protease CtpA/Prc